MEGILGLYPIRGSPTSLPNMINEPQITLNLNSLDANSNYVEFG
jgi:hypothetical protein